MLIKKYDKIALSRKDVKISYSQLLDYIDWYSTLYDAKDTEKIAIFSENSLEWIYAFYSGLKNKAICVPIDYMAVADEVAYMLNDSKPEIIFYSNKTEEVLQEAVSQLDYTPTLFNLDTIEAGSTGENLEGLQIEDVHDVAVIIYTSGTTGSPKGVMLTYDNILANIEAVVGAGIFTPEDVTLIFLPAHHVFPLMGSVIAPLYTGGTCALSPSLESSDIISTLQENKVSLLLAVPRFFEMIRKGIKDKIDKSPIAKLFLKLAGLFKSQGFSKKIFNTIHQRFGGHVKLFISGGAKLEPTTFTFFRTLGFNIIEGYGMTEAAPMISFPRLDSIKTGSVGQELEPGHVKIVNDEVITCGRNIMKGYYNKPEETAAVLKEGWLYTGDTGYIDDDGHLFLTGRKKEIIVTTNGKNINPVELENKIEAMTNLVKEIGVFYKDDILQAIIVPDQQAVSKERENDTFDLFQWEVIDKFNKKVSPYKRIMKFTISNEPLPRTRLEKLKRFQLAELAGGPDRKRKIKDDPNSESYAYLKGFLQEYKDEGIYPDDHLELNLGLDSLDTVRLQMFIKETFGIMVDDKQIQEHSTVEKLAEFIEENKTKISLNDTDWQQILKEKVSLKLPKSSAFYKLVKYFSGFLFKTFFKYKTSGMDNLPEKGPFILAPNHQSAFDPMLLLPELKNKITQNTFTFAKAKHFRKAWRRFLAWRSNIIVMGFKDDLVVSLQKMAEVLKQGKNLIIFPEGTRTKNGKIGRFKEMFAILSKELNVPIVPVAINGAYDILPSGRAIPRLFKEISIKYLPPVYPESYDYKSLTSKIKDVIVKSLD